MMRLGHGSAPIPVTPEEAMGGYADRQLGVTGVHDPLEVHAIVIDTDDDGEHRSWALVVADLVCVNRDAVLAVREALQAHVGISGAWVAATHTHAGPESGCRPGGDVTPPTVLSRLVEGSVAAARAAARDLVPGRLDVARTDVMGLASDRTMSSTGPQGVPVDMVVVSRQGQLQGILVVTPVHPTVLGAENSCVSADLSGGIRRALMRRLRDVPTRGPWVVSATGAAGDISTRFSRQARSTSEIDRLGEVVADAVIARLQEMLTGETSRPADGAAACAAFAATSRTVTLEGKSFAADSDALRSGARAEPSRDGDARDPRLLHVLRQGLKIAGERRTSYLTEGLSIEVAVAHLPGLTFAAVPAELFLSLGNDIRSRAPVPEQTVVLGYTNGYLGYLPARGSDIGYEVLVSPVVAGSGERVVDVAVQLAHHARDTNEREQSGV